MTESEVQDRDVLLKHAKHPQRVGDIADADGRGSCRNPLCGDHVEVAVKIDHKKNVVEDIRIRVSGCGISTASASLMSELMANQSTVKMRELLMLATRTLSSTEDTPWPMELQSLKPLQSLRRNPRKIPCALMAWYALKDALKD